jgi:magnesium and cobalt transporter
MGVDDAAAMLKTTWQTEATTVGGMVIEALGHLPGPGEQITIGEFQFEVERIADRAVASVTAIRVSHRDAGDAA